jgi:hypothetical protein
LNPPLVIGVDFDNTTVCYDELFHKVCRERDLIPADVPVNKSDVRNFLRRIGREDDWTEMQGCVYGARMAEASAFPGVKDFFRACRSAGHRLHIISHKTRFPFRGDQHDLHQAAIRWLEQEGFFSTEDIAMTRAQVFFELTKEAKLQRIGTLGCSLFIDDLPEFLAEPGFPENVQRVLFDPHQLYHDEPRFRRMTTWTQAREVLPL